MIFKLLQISGVDPSGYNRLMLHFAGLKSGRGLWVCALLCAVFAASGYFMVKPLASRRRKAIILGLHSLAMAFALAVFLQPELRLAVAQGVKSPLAVLVDGSESMSVSSGNKSRVELARDWLEANRSSFEMLSPDFEIKWFSFDEKLNSLPADFLEQKNLKAEGPDTKTLESLAMVRKEIGNKPLSGVIIISDGADRGELARAGAAGAEQRQKFASDFRKKSEGMGRIYTVLAGSAETLRDLGLVKVENDSYGFVKNPFVVTIELRAMGDIPYQNSVELWQEDKLLVARPFTLEPGKDTRVELEFVPQEVGRFLFRVQLPVYEGEASVENNQRVFPLTIIRDRIRALYIVGNPSWDEKFLRQCLKKNPAVDLVSFYILREYYDDPEAPEDELSLIPFPTNELFTKELGSFDLVIFQNFFGQQYMMPNYIWNLRDYVVNKGGALVYIGGPRAFTKDQFDAPLEDILPVDFSFKAPSYRPGKFRMRLTAAGSRHPVTRLDPDEFTNKRIWDGLGEFQGYNMVLRPKPDALALADTGSGETPVMIAVREAGKGRVMAIASDDLWRWHFQVGGLAQSSRYYQLFWERALRWLMKDPEMKPMSLSSVKESYRPGEEVSLFFNVRDNSYEPVSGATVELSAVKAPKNCGAVEQQAAEISAGKYQFKFKLDCPGGYRFRAVAGKDGAELGSDQEILVVSKESAEMEDLSLHPELLQTVAELSKGKMLRLDQSADKMRFDKLKLEEITSAKDIPVWDNWITWSALALFFGLTWGLRRYWGLS